MIRQDLFISSTFQDMHAERDLLHRVVIPELQDRFSGHRVHLDLIDLRWGISTPDEASEQANTAKILRVCFDEIERSKPFFIGFIGERYGWIPDKHIIESALLGYEMELPDAEKAVSITELEMRYALEKFESRANCFFFIRSGLSPDQIRDADTRSIYFPTDPAMQRCTDRLKAHLRSRYGSQVFDYRCRWDPEANKITGLEELGTMLIRIIGDAIASQLQQESSGEQETPFAPEQAIQKAHLRDLQTGFYGRKQELQALERFVTGSDSGEMAVVAPSGFGKSSLMAALCGRLSKKDITLIPFFAGISDRSGHFPFLARYCYATLAPDAADTAWDLEYPELKRRLLAALMDAAEKRPVLIVVDALDQFSDSRQLQELDWIQDQLIPRGVRILYSCLPGREDLFQKRSAAVFPLETLQPQEIPLVAQGIARRLHKEIPREALALLTQKTDASGTPVCGVPMYLASLLELLCSFGYDDFRRITARQHLHHLTPAGAINQYISDTIRSAGSTISDLIQALSAKSAGQLGLRYEWITALLVCTPGGITEQEILGITAGSPCPVTAADFSVYRRMFRMHLHQHQDGRWQFSHNIIQNALLAQTQTRNLKDLWHRAAQYYLCLPEHHPIKYPGLIHACGRIKDYRTLARCCFRPAFIRGADALCRLALEANQPGTGRNDLLEECSPEETFQICRILAPKLRELAAFNHPHGLDLCLRCICALQAEDFRHPEGFTLLSDYYFTAAEALLQEEDSRAHSFFEIALGLLEHCTQANPRQLPETALQISRIFADRLEWSQAHTYAKIAHRAALRADAKDPCPDLLAQTWFSLGSYQWSNPLWLDKTRANRCLYRAAFLAHGQGNWDLTVRAGIQYLRSGKLLQNRKHRHFLLEWIRTAPTEALGPRALVELLLFRARQGQDVALYDRACQAAVQILARENSREALRLYETTLHHYAYQLMVTEGSSPHQVSEIAGKLDRCCRKLFLVTGHIHWNEERIALANDLDAYCQAHRLPEQTASIHRETADLTRSRWSRNTLKSLSAAHSYTSVAIKAGLIVLALVIVTSVLLNLQFVTNHALDILASTLYNALETAANVTAVLGMLFFSLGLLAMDKESFDREANRRLLGGCRVLITAFLILLLPCLAVYFSSYESPYYFDRYFYPMAITMMLSVVFTCSITWFIAWPAGLLISRSQNTEARQRFRFLYRHRQWWQPHWGAMAFQLGTAVCFLLCAWLPDMDHSYNALDFRGTTVQQHVFFCWVPLALQVLLSGVQALISRLRWGNPRQRTFSYRFRPPANSPKRLILLILTLVLTVICSKQAGKELQFREYGYRVHDGLYYTVSQGEARIYHYYGDNREDVRVPRFLHGARVTEITDDAFRGSEIRSLSLPEGITGLYSESFRDCFWLEEIRLPQSLQTIGVRAFENCVNLQSLHLGSELQSIQDWAFQGCLSLQEVTAPKDAAFSVGFRSFAITGLEYLPQTRETGVYQLGSQVLTERTILWTPTPIPVETPEDPRPVRVENGLIYRLDPEYSVAEIVGAAPGATELVFDFPDTWSVLIPDQAFAGNPELLSVTVRGNLTLPSQCFYGCSNLRSVRLEGAVTVNRGCFANCLALEEVSCSPQVHLENHFDSDGIFENCIALKSFSWPQATQAIPPNCFRGCINLQRLELPATLTTVCDNAFSRCVGIEEVIYGGTADQWASLIFFNQQAQPFDLCGHASLIIGGKPLTEAVFGPELTRINHFCFLNYRTLEQITFTAPSVVIQERAFYQCRGLQRIQGLDRVELIDSGAFGHCRQLTELALGPSLTKVGKLAFEGCVGLTEVTLPGSIKSFGGTIFQSCSELRTVTMEEIWKGRTTRILGDNISPEVIFFPKS